MKLEKNFKMTLKLKPSAKIHRRYLLIEAESAEKVKQALLESLGEIGWAKASPMFVKVKPVAEGKIVLAIAREELNNVRAAIELSKDKIKVVRVSGTIKSLGNKKRNII